jgi:lysophospholipase L1-like esterase
MKRLALVALLASLASPAAAQQWVASWTGSAHGPYPIGYPTAQPELKFAFPSPEQGARDQTLRLIVKPDVWGPLARIRLSNAFGSKPVTFDGAFVGLQESGAAVVRGTNTAVTFGGQKSVTVPPGQSAMSDPVALPFVDMASPLLRGRKLAVSFHVAGESGPMTWHAKALQTSYVSPPGGGAKGADESEAAFPFSTASWYFLDALTMATPGAKTVVTFGDSITDGTGTTINGDDRWPDVLSRRLHAAYGDAFAVVNQGIGGNQVAGPAPADYAAKPIPGGPAAITRLDRDVTSLPGVTTVIWMEGINDFGAADASAETVIEGYKKGVAHLRQKIPGVKIFAATLTSALNSTPTHGRPEVEAKRKALNAFLRTSKDFDGCIDFDAATYDGATGEIKAMYQPNSSVGGPGDRLHPNRAGYAAMANAIDLKMITGR